MGTTGKNKSLLSRMTESRNFGLILGLVVLLIIAAIITPSMYSLNSLMNMLQNNAVYGLLAIGEMMVILTAGIDISIGATLSLTGVVCCRLMAENPGVPAVAWVLLALLIGALCGAFNGILVGYFKMVPMIATLGTMYAFRGFSFLFSGGQWWFPHQFTEGYLKFATLRILGVPAILWILLLVFALAILFLGHTSRGRRIYAIGTNRESSQVAGIREERVVFLAMTLCGMLAGLAGMLYTANYATCSYSIGESYEMTAIAICILGGVSINGGKGKVDGVIIGFLMMSVITYFISLLPGLSVWSDAIQGAIIIAAVALNIYMERSAEKRALRERGALI
ncbi:ABC transporter permease [Faecalicatena sp. AGMB00832]|uniref:ABC transporter permease n=1 Tax=Faecalicatena faecalis TaxID=2726362 RepID=A0ABS6D0I5_9FIRM|nr:MULTISPECIES: ABC transporter permease [Faecalicatena]MBU3875092.1 ABC transporter permease [Faecalicatena faecalis]MCI6467721.1 ABC transporter permease [Faecalicatena sp.]MDY5619637.1 ABC transporter permease [Lachnospiraceae bacterium]